MAGDGEAAERARRAAEYDYESDPRWADYWSNVLVPRHMAARPDVVAHFKRKFYQRYIDPNFVVDGMTSAGPSQSARTTPAGSSSASTRASSGSSTRPTTNNQLRFDRQSVHFAAHAWVLAVAVLGILPIIPSNLSAKAYRLSLFGTMCTSFYSLYSLYGKPRAWTLVVVQTWLQAIIAGKDFIRFMFCFMFLMAQVHFKVALIPVLCWSLDHVSRFLRRNFTGSILYRRYLEQPCLWVETNTSTLSLLSSYAEVSLGFLLTISIFSWQRNIMQILMYWNLLKLMYRAPVTSSYHQNVWSNIGRVANPFIHNYLPFLTGPLSSIQTWWLR
ncbi:hypothetical protein LUZ60_008252 [Juncus effusus]|nr:hypothetical protein LUZ60_008252 [Juncus effusus]